MTDAAVNWKKLMGNWHVVHSTLKLWKTGGRRNPTIGRASSPHTNIAYACNPFYICALTPKKTLTVYDKLAADGLTWRDTGMGCQKGMMMPG